MCITLTLLGQLLNVDGSYHAVNRNIQIINARLERLRHEISLIANADEEKKIEIYQRYLDDFEYLMFPSHEEYEIVQLPLFPLPREFLGNVIKVVNYSQLTQGAS